jgi:hypothetical protein
MATTVKTGNDIQVTKRSLFNDISKILRTIESGQASITLNKRVVDANGSDIIRLISDLVPRSAYRDILLNSFINAEKRTAGAGFLFLKMLGHDLKDISIPKIGTRVTQSDIQRILSFYSGDQAAKISCKAFEIAGRDGKLFLDKDPAPQTQIIISNQRTSWRPPAEFFDILSKSSLRLRSPALVFIDGIIESVAECHRIFHDSYTHSIPVLIFARGFGSDVISTSVENIKRGTASVVPILIPYDEIGANSMSDLAMCFCTDVISSLKGELISGTDILSSPRINEANIGVFGVEMIYENGSTDKVIKSLNDRLQHASHDESEILMSRIKRIGHHAITIKIGHEHQEIFGIYRDRIDSCLRLLPVILKGGIVQKNNALRMFEIIGIDIDIIPFESLLTAHQTCISFNEIINKNKCLVSLQ